MTTNDAKDKLMLLDEILVMEILEISTEDLLDRFEDRLMDKLDKIEQDLEEL